MAFIIALFAATFLAVAFYNFYWKRRNLPPGPMPWPILGNLLPVFRDKSGYRIFRKWADQYGPVFTVWWAEEPYIILADYGLMKEAYIKNAEAFNGRHILPIAHILSEANHSAGVARINGDHWRELRRFSMKILRDLGVGRNTMQERILPTIRAILHKLEADLSKGVDEHNMLPCMNFFTANVISELTFATGYYGENHKQYERMMHLSEIIHSNFTSIFGLLIALIPFLRHFPLFKHTYNKMNGPWEEFHAFFETGIQRRIEQRKLAGSSRRQSQTVASRKNSSIKSYRKRSGEQAAENAVEGKPGSRKSSGNSQRKISATSKPIGILKQSQNIPQQKQTTNTQGDDEVVGIFQQQPPRKFSGSAAGRKVSHVQWSVVVEKDGTSECFVDLFLDLLEENGPDKFFNMDSLRGMCFDLFVGGQEPTASTLGFMTIYLLLDQERQKKLHAEFDRFAAEQGWNGTYAEEEEWIELEDRPKLPYLNAVINETQRIANLLPMNLTHMTNCEAQISDYQLPKGIAVIAQMSCLFCDPKIFPEPERFIPERFIDENGQLKKCDELIPFSLGKRNCIGEGLARAELFLFAANFFNRFHVFPVDPLRPPSIEKKVYFTSMPQPYRCRLVRRQRQVPTQQPMDQRKQQISTILSSLPSTSASSSSPSSSCPSSCPSDEESQVAAATENVPKILAPPYRQMETLGMVKSELADGIESEKAEQNGDGDDGDDVNVAKQRRRGSSFAKCQEQQEKQQKQKRER